MTELELRNKLVNKAKSYIGVTKGSAKHHEIVDIYNSHKPLARSYPLKYSDDWCDGFASAMIVACGYTDFIPTEVGCGKHIDLFKAKGIWEENDAHIPKPADFIFYDWEDDGKGDNKGGADHIGIVEKVENGVITVIEGNKGAKSEVGRRAIAVNGVCIRGFGIPNYASKATAEPQKDEVKTVKIELPILRKGSTGTEVKTVQRILKQLEYTGADGKLLAVDGEYGNDTAAAVKRFQLKRGAKNPDGIVGEWTWNKLLKSI